jgi:CitMHS family citrate-Mg2+:H+ or citrate-Ca2+:H+ symporter
MSLALVGLLTVLVMLALIMTKRMSTMLALIAVPVISALIMGFGLDTSKFIISGLTGVAPIAVMFIFAIIFFGVVSDAGMFDPIISFILKTAKGDPVRVVVGNAILAMVVHLDGSGAVTFIITIPAMLPLYERLKLDYRVMACVTALGAGIMNMLPWGGPTLRAATALKVPVTELFNPVIPAQVLGMIAVLIIAYFLGRREAKRIGYVSGQAVDVSLTERTITDAEKALRRPAMFWVNIILTVCIVGGLIWGKVAPAVLFMLATVLALLCNYPKAADQRARVDAHAKEALLMASVLFAAGAFTGIMQGTGFIKAMATAAAGFIPTEMASHIPFVVGLVSMPLSLLFDPDSFYFGILPVIAEVMNGFGLPSIQIGQAAIAGQMTTGFPISPLTPATLLLVGLCKIELGDHQRFTIPLAFLVSLVVVFGSVIFGVYPF